MEAKMKKFNIIDLFIIGFIALLSVLLLFMVFSKPKEYQKNVLVTVKIEAAQGANEILPVAENSKEVYFNSAKEPVEEVSLDKEIANGQLVAVNIRLRAKGELDSNRYIFNGQRLSVNQKAEIHGKYFAQGKVTEIKYDN
jgi:flagellar basal body-associated protein FliL